MLLAPSLASCLAGDFFGPDEHTIRIIPDSVELLLGDRLALGVEDGSGDRIPAHVVQWTSFGRAIVEVDGDGKIAGVGPGTTAVVGRHRDAQATARVTIEEILLGRVAAGRLHSCGWREDGPAYCWGYNSHGQLGSDAADFSCGGVPCHFRPALVQGDHAFRDLAAGATHTCGVTTQATAYCWGANGEGQLGTGTVGGADDVHRDPQPVAGGHAFSAIAAGEAHSCAVTPDGTAYCWGRNDDGQLGDGTRQPRATPVRVATDLRFTTLTAGVRHTCGITTAGAAYCWGSNSQRQLGTGASPSSNRPVAVAGGYSMSHISAGDGHTCAVSTSSNAYCWGANSDGQLGNGITSTRSTPQLVGGGQPFSTIAAGGFHTCGIHVSGQASCWGSNNYRQLGNNTNVSGEHPLPSPTASSTAYTTISAGWLHTCAGTASGRTHCWGYNGGGQLGRDDVETPCISETVQRCSRRPVPMFGSR